MRTLKRYIKTSQNNRSKTYTQQPVFYDGDKCLFLNSTEFGDLMTDCKVVKSDIGDINRQHNVCVEFFDQLQGRFIKGFVNKFNLFLNDKPI